MSSDTESLELRGRLWLWHNAINETHKLLKLANRSKSGAEQSHIRTELEKYNEKLSQFCRSQPDYVEGTMKYSHIIKFNQQYGRLFPTSDECYSIHSACVELAIIYFCQILTKGYADTGAAAKNDKLFRDKHLTAVTKQVFPNPTELDQFNSLCQELLEARDQMIGHADGRAFDIQHGHPVSRMNMYQQAWQNIDLQYWQSFLENLRIAILEYSNKNNS